MYDHIPVTIMINEIYRSKGIDWFHLLQGHRLVSPPHSRTGVAGADESLWGPSCQCGYDLVLHLGMAVAMLLECGGDDWCGFEEDGGEYDHLLKGGLALTLKPALKRLGLVPYRARSRSRC